MTSLQKESESKCVRIHPKDSVCIGCPGAYEEYLASETTERIEWSPNLSPRQEWMLQNGETEAPEWFIRLSERVYTAAVSNRENQISEEVENMRRIPAFEPKETALAVIYNEAIDDVLQIIKH